MRQTQAHIINRHLRGTIFKAAAVTSLILIGLFTFFNFLEQLDDATNAGMGPGFAGLATALTLPSIVYELAPMCALLGTLVGLGALAQNQELIVLRAVGLSRANLALAVAKVVAWLIVIGFVAGELIAPSALSRLKRLEASHSESNSPSNEPIWISDNDRFIHIRYAAEADVLEDITIYAYAGAELVSVTRAQRAEFRDGQWYLLDVRRTQLNASQIVVANSATEPWDFELRPKVVSMVAISPERLSVWALSRYIVEMRSTSQSAERYVQSFWRRVSYPVAALAMVLITLPMALTPRPRSSLAERVALGAGIGLAFYLANQLCSYVGTVFGLHPIAAAVLPTGFVTALALVLNLKRV